MPAQSTFLASLLSGVVIALVRIFLALSFASLMFSGSLEPFLARGIAITLITNIVQMALVALFWSNDRLIMGIQDTPAVLIAVALASMITTAHPDSFATVIVFIACSTLLTGVFLLLLGTFRLGNLVRYIPYPVIGGFLAGSGWLLVQGAFSVMTGNPLALDQLPALADRLARWLPGVGFGLALFFGMRRFRHALTFPAILGAGVFVFFAGLILTGTTPDTAAAQGLFFGSAASGAQWQLPTLTDFVNADWRMIVSQLGTMGTIAVLTAIALLLNLSGIELLLQRELDVNRHLTRSGIANLLSGVLGGAVGFHSLSTSALQLRLKAEGRIVALLIVAFSLVVLFGGSAILTRAPRALLGGLLLFIGLDLLDNWLIQGRHKFNRHDWSIVALILIVIALSNFLVGIAVGLIVMVISFVFNSSRMRIFHRVLSGDQLNSRVDRNLYHQQVLNELGKQVYVLELQGFLFFGTAYTLLEMIRQRVNEEPPLRYLILDFKRVIDFDSSIMYSFSKAVYLARLYNFGIVFSNLSEHGQRELSRMGLRLDGETNVYADLDYALEWCENRLLNQMMHSAAHLTTLTAQLAEQGFAPSLTQRLFKYMEKRSLAEGEYLMHQDDPSDSMYFIESGQISVVVDAGNHRQMRMNTRAIGTTVGELGFYRHTPRSASVVADVASVVYRLDTECFATMKNDDPELLIAFHELMLNILSERLILANREIAALKQ